MDIKEIIEPLIKQAEHFNAGETKVVMDYNEDWEVKLVVRRKFKYK